MIELRIPGIIREHARRPWLACARAAKAAAPRTVGELVITRYSTLKRVLARGLRDNQALYADELDRHVTPDTVWLDAGCGHQVFANDPAREARLVRRPGLVVGCDLDERALRKHRTIHRVFVSDLERLPFRDHAVTLISCNMTVEHLARPSEVFAELFRVLSPNGRLILHTPNARSYFVLAAKLLPGRFRRWLAHVLDGRPLEDVFHTYYRANTRRCLERRLARAGFRDIHCRTVAGDAVLQRWPVLAALELLLIRATLTRWGRPFRVSMIVTATPARRPSVSSA